MECWSDMELQLIPVELFQRQWKEFEEEMEEDFKPLRERPDLEFGDMLPYERYFSLGYIRHHELRSQLRSCAMRASARGPINRAITKRMDALQDKGWISRLQVEAKVIIPLARPHLFPDVKRLFAEWEAAGADLQHLLPPSLSKSS